MATKLALIGGKESQPVPLLPYMFMDPHICMTLPEAVRVLRSVQAEGEALGAVLDERGEEGCEWAICLREGCSVQSGPCVGGI